MNLSSASRYTEHVSALTRSCSRILHITSFIVWYDRSCTVPATSILRNAENFYQTTRGNTSGHGNPNGHSSQDVNLNCNKYVLFVNITLKVS